MTANSGTAMVLGAWRGDSLAAPGEAALMREEEEEGGGGGGGRRTKKRSKSYKRRRRRRRMCMRSRSWRWCRWRRGGGGKGYQEIILIPLCTWHARAENGREEEEEEGLLGRRKGNGKE